MRTARLPLIAVIAVGLAALLVGIVVDASGSARRLAGSNLVGDVGFVAQLPPGGKLCQPGLIPGDSAALSVRVDSGGRPTPALAAEVLQGTRTVASGVLLAGGQGVADVPLSHIPHAVDQATTCITNRGSTAVSLGGTPTPPAQAARVGNVTQPGLVRMEYLRPGKESWWALLPTLLHRFGLGKSHWLGGWSLALVALLMVSGTAIAVRTLLHEGNPARARWHRIPRAGRACALVALLTSLAWSLLIPPFHVPDEISHVSYVQYFAQTGKLPKVRPVLEYSPEEQLTLADLNFTAVVGQPRNRPPWSDIQNRAVRQIDSRHPDRVGEGNASTATGNPPLYYALESIPYWISPSHNLLDRLVLMRLLSVLLAAGTVLIVFEFLRTLMPGAPWAWPVGALAVAFQPTFGFISGGVNNDNLLFLLSALTFLLIARAFRDGLTRRLAIGLGAVAGLGVLAKLIYLGIVPAVGLALLALVARAPSARRLEVARNAALAVACGAAALVAYLLVARFAWHRGLFTPGQISGTVGARASGTIHGALSYVWQLFLPRLPGMNEQIPGFPLHQVWFNGFIGRFGWLDYGYPSWVYNLAWYIAIAIVLLALVALARRLAALRTRWVELACYVTAIAGTAVLVGLVDYQSFISHQPLYEQARYLLPLSALYAAVIALAARAGGRRFGPALGAALVMLALAHTVFGQLITLTRYYG